MLNFKKWLNEAGGDNPMAEPMPQKLVGLIRQTSGAMKTGCVTDPNKQTTDEDEPPAPRKYGADRFKMKKK